MITCNLRSLIGLKGIGSQNRLSERTGISAKQLSRLANNKQQQISFHNIERLCTVLECSLDELFTIKGEGSSAALPTHSQSSTSVPSVVGSNVSDMDMGW